MSSTIDADSFGSVRFSVGLSEVGGEVVFLPCDPGGTLGTLNQQILQALKLSTSFLPTTSALERGYAIREYAAGKLCFVVSIGDDETANVLRRNLTAALSDKMIMGARSLWLPLMGTGYGGLPLSVSQNVIQDSLRATGWLERPSVRIIVARPGDPQDSIKVETTAESRSNSNASSDGAKDTGQTGSSDEAAAEGDEPGGKASAADLRQKMEPAAAAAISFAAALRAGRKGKGGSLSTTLLFYALAESQTGAAPADLRQDPSAFLFAGAVHALAHGRFKNAWAAYFSPTFRPASNLEPPAHPPAVTVNVRQIMEQAASLAKEANRTEIAVHDLVIALLNFPRGRHRHALEQMGISMPHLLLAYQDARVGQIGTTLFNDTASIDDRLGYRRYATAITNFLLDADTPPPLSVSIQAPWGVGKSSLMQQIRENLDPRVVRDAHKPKPGEIPPRLLLKDVLAFLNREVNQPEPKDATPKQLWTIWFNAWKYDTSEQVWAGLVDAIVDQISGRLRPIEREKFLLKLQLARIDDGIVRRKIYDRIVTIWWGQVRRWALLGVAAFGALFGVRETAEILAPNDWAIIHWTSWSPYLPLIVLALYLARTYFKSREKTQSEPAAFSLANYLKVPDYDLTLGAIHHIHQDLVRVLRSTPVSIKKGKGEDGKETEKKAPSPLVIFIDDLDRCSPSKVASVVEGVSMFLASEDYKCMFVIGMDPQMIAAALEDAHSSVRSHLPRYERTVPLGWRFMDKFIQLPFTIPPSHDNALESYIASLTPNSATFVREDASAGAQSSQSALSHPSGPEETAQTAPSAQSSTPQTEKVETSARPLAPTTVAEVAFKESLEVGSIIQEAAKNTSGNPREIKRLANLTRLYLGLRNERRKVERKWRSPTPSQYARWIVLTLRWPDMMRWLQWGADEFAWPEAYREADLTTRRLRLLEYAAERCATAKDWTNVLATNLNVPGADESDWATDPKLFEFFSQELEHEPEARLSGATALGFW